MVPARVLWSLGLVGCFWLCSIGTLPSTFYVIGLAGLAFVLYAVLSRAEPVILRRAWLGFGLATIGTLLHLALS